VSSLLKKEEINPDDCFGKTMSIKVGGLLGADKMVTGNVEKFGNNIIFILRMVDVNSEKIVKTSVIEYLDEQDEIQLMVKISVNDLLEIENDQNLVDLLIDYDRPVTSSKTTLKLNGPRMGLTFATGLNADIISAPKSEGGFNASPLSSMFGYQFEYQYIGSGDFQALLETIIAINGIENGTLIPSLTFLNGFRFNNSGWELGLGPIFRVIRSADGYYDDKGDWNLAGEMPTGAEYEITKRLDSRGNAKVSLGLIVAAGKTFRSGRLNMPVNLYWSPKADGDVIGLSLGFNVAKKAKKVKE
jgi:hypothetical protein